jgi:hypothetical protein
LRFSGFHALGLNNRGGRFRPGLGATTLLGRRGLRFL